MRLGFIALLNIGYVPTSLRDVKFLIVQGDAPKISNTQPSGDTAPDQRDVKFLFVIRRITWQSSIPKRAAEKIDQN